MQSHQPHALDMFQPVQGVIRHWCDWEIDVGLLSCAQNAVYGGHCAATVVLQIIICNYEQSESYVHQVYMCMHAIVWLMCIDHSGTLPAAFCFP